MNDYTYIVRIYDDDHVIHEYKYDNHKQAMEHYKMELSNSTEANLFRSKDGKLERYSEKRKCNCGKCAPKKIKFKHRSAD